MSAGRCASAKRRARADGLLQRGAHRRVQAGPGPSPAPRPEPGGAACSTPSNCQASSAQGRRSPACRTASMMSRTLSSASATVPACARGTAARSPARDRCRPRRSTVRKLTAAVDRGHGWNCQELGSPDSFYAPGRGGRRCDPSRRGPLAAGTRSLAVRRQVRRFAAGAREDGVQEHGQRDRRRPNGKDRIGRAVRTRRWRWPTYRPALPTIAR